MLVRSRRDEVLATLFIVVVVLVLAVITATVSPSIEEFLR